MNQGIDSLKNDNELDSLPSGHLEPKQTDSGGSIRRPTDSQNYLPSVPVDLAGILRLGTQAQGTGKSPVLRTIAGLWPGGDGSLEHPAFAHLMFLPQRPYMVEGSLRDPLLYPYPERGVSDEEIRQVVADVNLPDVLGRVDDVEVAISTREFAKRHVDLGPRIRKVCLSLWNSYCGNLSSSRFLL